MILSLLLGAAAMAAGARRGRHGRASRPASRRRWAASSPSAGSRRTAPTRPAPPISPAPGSAAAASLAFFQRLQNLEFRLNIPQDNGYARTHPLNGERIAALENRYQADPAWDRPTDPALEARFQRVRAKLSGYVDDPRRVLQPLSRRATARSRPAMPALMPSTAPPIPTQAMAEVDSLLASAPHDPYFLELKGQVLLESGQPARGARRRCARRCAIAPDQPLIAALLGHALISTEDPANFEEAKRVLRLAVGRDNDNPFAWYQLGIVYDREGDEARAALATAERYNLQGQPQLALPNAEQAMMGIPVGTPDWLRAQDIAMVSRSAVEQRQPAEPVDGRTRGGWKTGALAGLAGLLIGARRGRRAIYGFRGAGPRRDRGRSSATISSTMPRSCPRRWSGSQQREAVGRGRPAPRRARDAVPRRLGGAADGDVVLVEFFDYACGYCRASNPDVERLLREDPRLKVVWRECRCSGRTARRPRMSASPPPQPGPLPRSSTTACSRSAGRPRRRSPQALQAVGRRSRAALTAECRAELGRNIELARAIGATGTPDLRRRRPRARRARSATRRSRRRSRRASAERAAPSSSAALIQPLNPCATTYHSDEPLRLAGGLACLTVAKRRFSSATRLESAPPASTLATKAPPGRSTSAAKSSAASTRPMVRR